MISTSRFSAEYLLDCLEISSEHEALELADRIEASMYTWRQKACSNYPKSSWETVKEKMEGDKNVVLAERAEILLFSLKQRFPELAQTTLDTSKIQYNKVSSYETFSFIMYMIGVFKYGLSGFQISENFG
ncbi:putative PRONE domain, Rop guanine nucleotide exchange factor [Helianthus anomalus]